MENTPGSAGVLAGLASFLSSSFDSAVAVPFFAVSSFCSSSPRQSDCSQNSTRCEQCQGSACIHGQWRRPNLPWGTPPASLPRRHSCPPLSFRFPLLQQRALSTKIPWAPGLLTRAFPAPLQGLESLEKSRHTFGLRAQTPPRTHVFFSRSTEHLLARPTDICKPLSCSVEAWSTLRRAPSERHMRRYCKKETLAPRRGSDPRTSPRPTPLLRPSTSGRHRPTATSAGRSHRCRFFAP